MGGTSQDDENAEKYLDLGKEITNTCHESYIRTATHLGPEAFRFTEGSEAKALRAQEKYYILRPETFESYFILYRLTKDQKYRDWAWDAIEAIEQHCRSPTGYSGIKNVYLQDPQKDDVQQSFFIAEVLKVSYNQKLLKFFFFIKCILFQFSQYLYLIFSDDSLLQLDEWVYNTEAHVIPVRGNQYYRESSTQV